MDMLSWLLCAALFGAPASGPTSAETGPPRAAAVERPTTAPLELNAAVRQMSSPAWNQITTDTIRARDERSLRFEVPYGGKTAVVEQRRYEIRHASPMVLTSAFRSVTTRGLGRVYFDPQTAELVVTDFPEVHARLWRYHQAMDTPKPARLLTVPKPQVDQAMKILNKRLSPSGELIAFEDEGVIIVRDDEPLLGGVETALRAALARGEETRRLHERHSTSRPAGPAGPTGQTGPTGRSSASSAPVSMPVSAPASGPGINH